MTKKIEITSSMANVNVNTLLSNIAGNNQSVNGPLQMYLMGGDVPIDENGYFPKNFTLQMPTLGEGDQLTGMTIGTYTASITENGQTITAAVDVSDSTTLDNFRITSRTGTTGFGPSQVIAFPFQIPGTFTGYGDSYTGLIDPEATADFSGTTLVNWKNNRVIISNNSISTYAAVATSSGTATWFYAYNGGSYIVGTVGTTGSGADLELDSVSIVQGKTYGISNLRIQMPTSFTY